MISARDLTKHFADYVALEALDLEVQKGEVFGLLGPNGAGKTTTIRLLTGLVAPTRGSATVAGHDVVREGDCVRAAVGILTETPSLYVRLDALENLRFFARLYRVAKAEARIESLLRRFDLWDRRRESVGAYSKGMRQKLAIARAVLHDPKVVFLDEPTSALDPESALLVRTLIEELRSEGRTIVLCTHNLDEADRLSHRIGVLSRGRVVHSGTPRELRHRLYGRATRVRVRGEAAVWVAKASALPFVASVTADGAELRVKLADPEGDNPALVRVLVEAGADVVEVREETRALEEVYLDLVRGPSEPAP